MKRGRSASFEFEYNQAAAKRSRDLNLDEDLEEGVRLLQGVDDHEIGLEVLRLLAGEEDEQPQPQPQPQRQRQRQQRKAMSYDQLLVDSATAKLEEGAWQAREERLLLHIVYCFTSAELRVTAAVARKCGVHRSSRAIDKKVKRTLRFSKWRERDVKATREAMAVHLREDGMQLTSREFANLQAVRAEFIAAGWRPGEPFQSSSQSSSSS